MVKNKAIGLSVAFTLATLMVGCANVTTGQLHAPLEVMPTEVCIIRNPQVTIDAAIPSPVGFSASRHQIHRCG